MVLLNDLSRPEKWKNVEEETLLSLCLTTWAGASALCPVTWTPIAGFWFSGIWTQTARIPLDPWDLQLAHCKL